LAEGAEAHDILTRFAALSKPYGTTIEVKGDSATVVRNAPSVAV